MPLGPNDARLANRFCRLMHDEHVNATRTHTVPFTETWLEAADHEGLGVSYEGTWAAAAGSKGVAAGRPLVLAGLNPGNVSLDALRKIRSYIEAGGKVLWLNPGTMATAVYPEYIKGVLDSKGEIMNMDIPESSVFDGLEPLDIRNFNNNQREAPIVCAGAFKVMRGEKLSAPASFTRVHGYLSGNMEQRVTAMEKLRGFPVVRIGDKGVLYLSQASLDKAATDPVAGRLLTNMLKSLAYDLP